MSRLALYLCLLLALSVGAFPEEGDFIETIAWAPDASALASGHYSGRVTLHDVSTGALLREVRKYKVGSTVDKVVFLDPTTLLSWTFDGQVSIDKLAGDGPPRQWTEKEAPMQSAVLSPDGKMLAWQNFGKVRIRDLASPKGALRRPAMDTERNSLLAFSQDSRTLAVARGPNVVLFDALTGQRLGKLQKDGVFDVYAMKFTPGGTLQTVDNISVREWSVPAGHPVGELARGFHYDAARWLVASSTGEHLASGGLLAGKTLLHFWPDFRNNPVPAEISGQPLAVLADGLLISLLRDDTEVTVEMRSRDGVLADTQKFTIPDDDANMDLKNSALSPDGHALALPIGNTLKLVQL